MVVNEENKTHAQAVYKLYNFMCKLRTPKMEVLVRMIKHEYWGDYGDRIKKTMGKE